MAKPKLKDQRVVVLVDIQNLYYSSKVLYGRKVNYKAVLDEVVGGRKLIRAIAYGISTAEGTEEKFFEALEKSGYEVKTKDLQIFAGGQKKGDWDVGITVDAIKLSRNVDALILVSGDGDYAPLVRYLQNTAGCLVEGAAFEESTSSSLLDILDDFTNFSTDMDRFLV
ncbi:MAG TPA: NYN domain-containing protein [Candidatus Moranbacteria bacterium]|nr:NYN domain-containing protein [Candidatus Moranbacteria bacterium]